MGLLDKYPKLAAVTNKLDSFLRKQHPEFFGKNAKRPILQLKKQKVIHDSLWGTFSFSWRELAIFDTPLIQRLRNIQQIGLAYQVYPSARHSRLEHSLGVLVMASRIFDSLVQKYHPRLRDCIKVCFEVKDELEVNQRIEQLKQELRLAALIHDVGHSLYSHASERAFSKLTVLIEAAEELSDFAGKKKGAGEVISFCFALTPCLGEWLERATAKLNKESGFAYDGPINLSNVALMIVGRSCHPFLQFLGDIISSDIDADKLDYILRDATSAGLPLRYDVDMYLYSIQLDLDFMEDGEGNLEALYKTVNARSLERHEDTRRAEHPFYEVYRLCLPKRAMHVLEQIVICKMMLFSYVYHHPKVRAAEGMLELMLDLYISELKQKGKDDWEILEWFLQATDAHLIVWSDDTKNGHFRETAYRIVNRLLPREVMRLSASETTGPQRALLATFLKNIRDKAKGDALKQQLESEIGTELIKRAEFRNLTWKTALAKAGMWLDVPKAPKFEDTEKVISNAGGKDDQTGMFPVHAWQQAYTNYRCYARIYAYSEYHEAGRECAKAAMKRIIGIEDDAFYKTAERQRL